MRVEAPERRRRWSGRIIFAFIGCATFVLICSSFYLVRQVSMSEYSRHSSGRIYSKIYEKGSRGKETNGQGLEVSVPKFVTVVMPSVVKPQERKERLRAITETWGPNAHALYVVHDLDEFHISTEGRKPRQSNAFPKPLVVPSHITEDLGFDRLQYVYKTVLNHESKPDYAFFVNDHTFVIPEHLCLFLSSTQQQRGEHPTANVGSGDYHLYAGHAMIEKDSEYMFNSGASGYVLSRKTLKSLVDIWSQSSDTNQPQASPASTLLDSCLPPRSNNKAKWFQGNPGLIVAKCLHYALHVDAIDTRDNVIFNASTTNHDNGIRKKNTLPEHIFHAFGLVREVTGKVDQWYRNKHRRLPFAKRSPGKDEDIINELLPSGTQCCSPHTISFHYVYQAETKALHHLRHWVRETMNSGNVESDELMSRLEGELYRVWPDSFQALGGYSQGLPRKTDQETKGNIMKVLEKISGLPVTKYQQCWDLRDSM